MHLQAIQDTFKDENEKLIKQSKRKKKSTVDTIEVHLNQNQNQNKQANKNIQSIQEGLLSHPTQWVLKKVNLFCLLSCTSPRQHWVTTTVESSKTEE